MTTLITGGTGMVGYAFGDYDVLRVGSSDYDLTSFEQCVAMIEENQVERIIHLAARVGGVKGNMDYVGTFFRDNILMNTNLLEAARITKVEKVLSLLSTCIYPDAASYPLTETSVHEGPPHESNFGYAYAKRMLHIQSLAYRKEWGCNFTVAIPNNLYGANDNFDKVCSHVIPSMIRKIHEAKLEGRDEIILWGDGTPLREFTYAKDTARSLLWLLDNYEDSNPVNIGFTKEYSIKEVAGYIMKEMEFDGKIKWDISMPKGQHRKPSNNTKFLELYPDFKYTKLSEGLAETCKWFKESYPNVRGV